MVEGIERFRDAMAAYADNYIIIGGTACDIVLDGSPMRARPTRDIDLIVVVEKLSREFVEAFGNSYVREAMNRQNEPAYVEAGVCSLSLCGS